VEDGIVGRHRRRRRIVAGKRRAFNQLDVLMFVGDINLGGKAVA